MDLREKWSWKNHNYENAAKPHRTDISSIRILIEI